MTGPDKETFIELYTLANGDYYEFNDLLESRGEEGMAQRTFYRRRSTWVTNVHAKGVEKPLESEDDRPVAGGTIQAPHALRGALKGRKYVFTAAQNNTFVHEEFWDNLLAFCEHRGAELVVGKFRYNKSGFQNCNKNNEGEDLWYDPKITPYIVDESRSLPKAKDGVVWCGELDILPTAVNPLSGLDSYTATASSIIPHAKVQLKSIPVLKGDPVKMLYTTGACTQRNYIPRKAGQKAEFHHVFGALLVEIDKDGDHFARQLIADSSGSFHDLTDLIANGKVEGDHYATAINWGDIHAEMTDKTVAEAAWLNEDSMLDTLLPDYQLVHDLTDFKARNHHNIKDPHFLAERYFDDSDNVEQGMMDSAYALMLMDRDWCDTLVVDSNHDQAFKRWLGEADIRQDPSNAEYFHTFNANIYKHIRMKQPYNVFEDAVRKHLPEINGVQFLNEDDSFTVHGIECGMHGHRGPNGARGNPNSLRNLGRKCNIGHSHSAAIIDGVYVAGISCKMDLGYNKGPSSWSQSHIITYANGKRQICTMKNGKWRA